MKCLKDYPLDTQNDVDFIETGLTSIDTECNLLPSTLQETIHPSYTKLPARFIRLVRLLPGGRNTTVQCKILKASVDDHPPYTALSYVWGSQLANMEISVDGRPLLVPKNLWRFLHQARESNGDSSQVLWIDMLSINQKDNDERVQQVSLIHVIFKMASRVFVWLGPAYGGSDEAMEALSRPISHWEDRRHFTRIWNSSHGSAIKELRRRLYWRRLWVFQELCLGQAKQLLCGGMQAPWENFEAFMVLVHQMSNRKRLHATLESLDQSPAMRMIKLSRESMKKTSLTYLAQATNHLKCFDIRDKIYAVLGLATTEHENIQPDYSIEMPTVLNKFLRNHFALNPPKALLTVTTFCSSFEYALSLDPGTSYIMAGQQGQCEPYPPDDDYDDDDNDTHQVAGNTNLEMLWWAFFYNHTQVQDIFLRSHSFKSLARHMKAHLPDTAAAAASLKSELRKKFLAHRWFYNGDFARL